jgi:hypothetical protein
VRDSTSWSEPRTTDKLSAFLKQQCTSVQPTPKKPVGAPHTIIVTASGIRAADLCRSLKAGLPKEGVKDPNVAKLFAKHMKLAEQVTHLKKNKYGLKVVIVKSANGDLGSTLESELLIGLRRCWRKRLCRRPT